MENKMHKMAPRLMTSLVPLITIISQISAEITTNRNLMLKPPMLAKERLEKVGNSLEVLVIDDIIITEEDDREKAFKIGKTFIWRYEVSSWDCQNGKTNRPKGMGFNELADFCEKWKLIAMAVNVHLKNWERNNENPLGLKLQLRVAQGELLMSSAMLATIAVFRDLFLWGNGKNLKIKIQLENEQQWKEIVGMLNIEEREKQLVKEPNEQNKFNYQKARKFWQEVHNVSSETPVLQKSLLNSFLDALEKLADKCNSLMDDKDTLNKLKFMENVYDGFMKLWHIVQEFGLDMERMCAAGRKISKISIEIKQISQFFDQTFDHVKKLWETEKPITLDTVNEYLQLPTMETKFGEAFWYYQHKMHAEMVKQMGNKLKQFAVPDPCKEAKLRVKNN